MAFVRQDIIIRGEGASRAEGLTWDSHVRLIMTNPGAEWPATNAVGCFWDCCAAIRVLVG